ncbi:Transcriptional regulator, AraC family [[Clostridium] ultunense Esp]|uniref:Transcriptional regulator, AraC family n=1 Tax=[Clostridium] ultunense Esp TaxID=1288971 RepID=M1ZL92_9FIRM|nr:helix-turn-helix domain-containing protein [Schnuerera ultunensis]CCQ96797.1 Transcriptional regulator, AraC family [[Clostridium] ultunense Esp]SHD75561.1 Transcriptional regulator, AraC family [[Clostridium] ultunense Esp]
MRDFKEYQYEMIQGQESLPINVIIHSVEEFQMHWHKEIEILFILEGSINVRVGEESYFLRENDLILINCNELHSTRRLKDNNALLAIQIDPEFYNSCYPQFNKLVFDCKSFIFGEEQERFDIIRYYIAKIVWELNKRNKGYQFVIGNYLYLLAKHLLTNFDYVIIEDEAEELRDEDIVRLQRIIEYVNKNIDRKITLKEIAEREHVNYYYLSHFIKGKMGISFQEYVNSVRLYNAVDMLKNTDKSIIDISHASGFSNVNSFNRIFKETYNCSPSEYRKNSKNMSEYVNNSTNYKTIARSKTYLDVDRTSALKKLFTYLKPIGVEVKEDYGITNNIEYISVSGMDEGQYLEHYWQNLITFGRAHEGLRANWQKQFREIQREIGFKYIRFHGIFMDEMMVYNVSPEGNVEYNWTYVDELFDFFMEMNIKPFIELSFMPRGLKRSDETVFWWKGNISPPKDIKLWTDLVQEFIKHCINRYGIGEVESWYFEVWNEPEYEYVFWAGTREEYFEFYKDTALAIKSISKNLKVGGPAITHGTILGSSWLKDFLIFCQKNNVPLDFLSIHIYPEYIPEESVEKFYQLIESGVDVGNKNFKPKRIYHEKNHVLNTINIVNEKIESILNRRMEVHITEWNASSQLGNPIHDTCYVSTYIISNVLQSIDKVDSLGYWAFTDIFEEQKLGISHFHGGFGLMNKDGIKKPSYFAYYLLSKLGNEIIDQGEDYIITRSGEDIQILAYNYTYFDDLFLSGDTSHINHRERYLIYENKDIREIEFNINGVVGDYKIIKYKLNREHGSAFDEWLKMGLPENMTLEEIEYLKGKAKPEIIVEYVGLKGEYRIRFQMPVHGAEMLVLEKKA